MASKNYILINQNLKIWKTKKLIIHNLLKTCLKRRKFLKQKEKLSLKEEGQVIRVKILKLKS